MQPNLVESESTTAGAVVCISRALNIAVLSPDGDLGSNAAVLMVDAGRCAGASSPAVGSAKDLAIRVAPGGQDTVGVDCVGRADGHEVSRAHGSGHIVNTLEGDISIGTKVGPDSLASSARGKATIVAISVTHKGLLRIPSFVNCQFDCSIFAYLIASISNKDLVVAVAGAKRVGHSANALSGSLRIAEGGASQSNSNDGCLHLDGVLS